MGLRIGHWAKVGQVGPAAEIGSPELVELAQSPLQIEFVEGTAIVRHLKPVQIVVTFVRIGE